MGSPGPGRPRIRSAPKPLETVSRALDVIDCLCQAERELSMAEIARRLDLSPATAHRILATVESRGVVRRDPQTQRYSMGLHFMQSGLQQLNNIRSRQVVHPYLLDLAERTGETAVLALRAGFERIYVDQVESARPVRHVQPLWQPVPLHLGSSGRVILAHLPDEEVERYVETVRREPLTENTITDAGALHHRLRTIRERGYDFAVAERLYDTAGVAAPILEQGGRAIGAILVCGPAYRSAFIDECHELLRQVASVCSVPGGRIEPAASPAPPRRRAAAGRAAGD